MLRFNHRIQQPVLATGLSNRAQSPGLATGLSNRVQQPGLATGLSNRAQQPGLATGFSHRCSGTAILGQLTGFQHPSFSNRSSTRFRRGIVGVQLYGYSRWTFIPQMHPKSITKYPAIAGVALGGPAIAGYPILNPQLQYRSTIAGSALDGPAIAGDQGFQGSKKEGPGRFVVNFGGRLQVVRIWMDRLQLVATLTEYGE